MPTFPESSAIDLQEKNRLLEEQNENLKLTITDLDYSVLRLQEELQLASEITDPKADYIDPSVAEDYIQQQVTQRIEEILKREYDKLEQKKQTFNKKESDLVRKQSAYHKRLSSLESREQILKKKAAATIHKKSSSTTANTLRSIQKLPVPVQSKETSTDTKTTVPTVKEFSERDASSLPNLFYCVGDHSFYTYQKATKINLTSSTPISIEHQQSSNKPGK